MFRKGDKVFLHDVGGYTIKELEPRNYIVRFDPNQGAFYLQDAPSFELPSKLYGEVASYSERYLNSFRTWGGNLGVLLTGLKGTGKSLLARHICMHAGMPVIMITEAFSGPDFLAFLSHIPEDAIIFLDEFEKVFQKQEEQNTLLSVLDGSFKSKILFLLTANDHTRITQYLNNRPGRIHYRRHYEGLNEELIREVCSDLLDDETKTDQVYAVCMYIGQISLDILTALIREVNLYPEETPMEVMGKMNLNPTSTTYDLQIYRNDVLIGQTTVWDNPLTTGDMEVEWYGPDIDNDPIDTSAKTWNDIELPKRCRKEAIKANSIIVTADHEELEHKWVLVYKRKKKESPSSTLSVIL